MTCRKATCFLTSQHTFPSNGVLKQSTPVSDIFSASSKRNRKKNGTWDTLHLNPRSKCESPFWRPALKEDDRGWSELCFKGVLGNHRAITAIYYFSGQGQGPDFPGQTEQFLVEQPHLPQFPAVLVHGKRGVENFPAACGLDWGALSSSKNESEWLYFHLPCCGAYYTLGQEYRDMNLSLPYSSIFLVYSQQNLSTTNWNYLFSILTNHMASWDENQSSASSCILLTLTAISSLKSLKKKSFSKNLVFFGTPWKISPCGETHSSTSCFRGCWIPHPLGLRFTHSGGSWFSISVARNTYTHLCRYHYQLNLCII